ncbi:hypothetical protein ATO6_20265 [Oceanicola sp. 22II-s10i]|uniref:hypothetical protein n=1 Tax=Oceanicola sp. 22II-s10i TaxID=1317116 RepID=UPI000B521DB8|nr:hypothetical protein [Oceanicola sp. 22II-s10i]OWU83178.1 hypothetical protein ATO6_20265 [Oceanicola sp. 22II-s10i]
MTTQALSRKEKRARIAKASKLYGIKGEESLMLHEAYRALNRGETGTALQMAHPVTQSHPANPHGWIILGGAALNQREGATAKAFFGKAAEGAPKDPVVLAGMAKAHVLCAEVEPACDMVARAVAAGSDDVSLVLLYLDFMSRLGRRLKAVDVVAPMARRVANADLSFRLGNMLVEADETVRAIEFLDRAYQIDPIPEAYQIAKLRSLLYSVRLDEAEAMARQLIGVVTDRDTVCLVLLTVLRVRRRLDEAETLIESFEFATPEAYAQARGILANIEQDRGNTAAADAAYVEALHVAGDAGRVGKAYGVFRFRAGDFAGGQSYFDTRFPEVQRRRIPLDNAAPEILAQRSHLWVMTEQGIGDQLALMQLLRLAPLAEGARVTFVGDARMGALLNGNTLGLAHLPQDDFLSGRVAIAPQDVIYLGDLTRYLADHPASAHQGSTLRPDAGRVAHLRKGYEAQANGRPIVGVAWASRSLIGALRSIALSELVRTLPEGALVVNLQYGATDGDMAAARSKRPDLTFVTDRQIDQMQDLAGFAAQIAALDTVVSIDNTTVHMAGAIGHADTHVLLPAGSECMWYWGETAVTDPWYGCLTLHRQAVAGDWSAPLDTLGAALSGR